VVIEPKKASVAVHCRLVDPGPARPDRLDAATMLAESPTG
jgi:hypothetical protein